MYEIKNLENNIVVCPTHTKKYIQKNTKELLKCKFYTMEKLISELTYKISENAIFQVSNHFSFDIDVAKMYIDNLIYLDYLNNEKTLILKDILLFLEENNLIDYNKTTLISLSNYTLEFVGYTYLPKLLISLISQLDYKFIDINEYNTPSCINIFQNDDDELLYLAESISKLVQNNVELSDIKIIYSQDLIKFNRVFNFYNIPINYNNKPYLKEIISINDLIFENEINYEYVNTVDIAIRNEIINIINETKKVSADQKDFNKIFNYKFDKHRISKPKFLNAIEIIDMNEALDLDKKHIFIPAFCLGSYPVVNMDIAYFKDSELTNLPFETSAELNKHNYDLVKKLIKSNNLIYLSHHEYSNGDRKYLSNIIKDLKIEEIHHDENKFSNFSNIFNQLLYSMKLDQYTKYTVITNGLLDLNQSYNIPYLEYDNSFSGLKYGSVSKILNNNLKLSYTSLNKFNECKFAFYIQKILKIDIYEETFPLFIGTLFHEVLKESTNNSFSLEDKWNDVVSSSKYILSSKEKFLLKKLKEELATIIDIINEQNSIIKYKDMLFEEEVKYSFNLDNYNTKVTFTGIIDKIYYKTIDIDGVPTTYISVVDYKTGKLDIDLKLVEYGLSLQLPIYLHLSKKIEKFENVKVYGFFLQNILTTEIASRTEEEYNKTKKDNLKLRGYVVDNINEVFEFDPTIYNSEVIKGLRKTKEGNFYAYSKVLTEEFLNKLDLLVSNKIKEASNDILNSKFTINPKIINNKNISCNYCKFSDICYHSGKDNVYIDSEADENEMD